MTTTQIAQALLLPVGQFFGTFHPAAASTERYHRVRLGDEVWELDDQRFTVWALAHGTGDRPAEELWTVPRARDAAAGQLSGVDTTRNPGMADPLVLPVGRYTGEFHPAVGAPVKYHSLSIGRLSVTLEDPQAFAVWAAAHRPVDLPDGTWDRAAVTEAARRLGVADPNRIVAEFLEDGLLVEITPDALDVVDLARAYRVLPLSCFSGMVGQRPRTQPSR
ncbi:hypothetical protein NIE79_004618 [Micromonospora sp. NIE79]|uniref:Uncharacterized protein n=1 Tax=Micromonospora trifolii TaxID=2911208 RepID=A0ABS9NA04_9ACTN|nr:hypothetical protein [Micromonospora trifolii]MCG5446054.1 hypothetical protein [Micromonospora trifolii]